MVPSSNDFYIKNCSLSQIATGEKAASLYELRDKISHVGEDCIYNHFWGDRMNPKFVHSQYHNDFASWIFHQLHDQNLAEKLSIIDPTEFPTMEDLRQEVLETIELRLDDYNSVVWTGRDERFNFIGTKIIIFETPIIIQNPEQLSETVEKLPPGSIFYHFIDARIRTSEKIDDFSFWLKGFGDTYNHLIEKIQEIDPYFMTLTMLREHLAQVIKENT